ncbi:MAG: transglycosylase domain-containing protein [Nannocystaceae bacterium]
MSDSQPRKRRWGLWALGGLGLVLAGGLAIAGTYPYWAGSYVEDEIETRLAAKSGGEVEIGSLELDYDKVVVDELSVQLDGAQLMFDRVSVQLDRDALWDRKIRVIDVVVTGGSVSGEIEALQASARKFVGERKESGGPQGRIALIPQALSVEGLEIDVRGAGAVALTAGLGFDVVLAEKKIALKLSKVAVASESGKSLKATQLNTKVEWERNSEGFEATFPLSVEIKGGATSITDKIAIAGTSGQVTVTDPQFSTIQIDLRGGFSDSDEVSELEELWSLVGEVQRDLSAGQVNLEMKAFELGRVPQVLANLPVVDSADATVGGKVSVDFADKKAVVAGDVELAGLNVNHPLLARQVVPGLGFKLDFRGSVDPGASALDIEHATITRGDVALKLDGQLVHPAAKEQRKYKLHAVVPPVTCQAVLDALPHELVPSLVGFKVDGQFGLDISADIDFSNLDEATLSGKVDYKGCVAKRTPEIVSAKRLNGKFSHRPVMRDGSVRKVDLFPGSGTYSSYDQISKFMTAAVMTTEDGGFWRHKGFLPSQFEKALRRNLAAGRVRLGASTISMQMVKNVLLSHERTLSRKLQEMILTWYVEQSLSKKRILEIYLNVIEFGPGIYGVTRASGHYFGKHPLELNAAEAAYLALMLPSPVRRHIHYCEQALSPRFEKKLRKILQLMHERGRIDAASYEAWKDFQIVFSSSELRSPEGCRAEIKRLMDARSTQHAMSGMLTDTPVADPAAGGEHPVLDDPALDFGGDPADGEVDARPAMDVADGEETF